MSILFDFNRIQEKGKKVKKYKNTKYTIDHFSVGSAKYLIIVESPSKCSTIEYLLGTNFKCIPSFGHIFFIPSLKQIYPDFSSTLNIKPSSFEHFEFLKHAISLFASENVFIATDFDREGDAIAYHIFRSFHVYKRFIFKEISKTALEYAFENWQDFRTFVPYSQHARTMIDLTIGHLVSPLLWKFIYNNKKDSGLSAGRCQTPALRLIYENELNNTNTFDINYKINASFFSKNIPFVLNHVFNEEEKIIEFLEKSKEFQHLLELSSPKQTKKHAPEPFNTSCLLQTASQTLHYSPKETMELCQQLYQAGHITYIRTENKKYSTEFLEKAKTFILKTCNDEKYLGDFSKIKNTNDNNPHEAIRVTYIDKQYVPDLEGKLATLYKLIWNNTVQSCMSDAVYNNIDAFISAPDSYKYKYTIEIPIFLGWKKVCEKKDDMTNSQNNENSLLFYFQSIKGSPIQYNFISSIISIQNKHTYYNESSLIKKLEDLGIGRPSTFSLLVDTIQERGYVKKCDLPGELVEFNEYKLTNKIIEKTKIEKVFGNEKNKLVIQPIGILAIEFLIKHFNHLFSYEYTREIEDFLDKIENNNLEENEKWYSICAKCKNEIEENIKPLKKLKKQTYKINDEYELLFHKFGASLRKPLENGEMEYKTVNPKIKIDINKLQKGEYTIDELLEIKNDYLGKYEDQYMFIKTGKYGPYVQWGDNKKSIKSINKPVNDIVLNDIIQMFQNSIKEIDIHDEEDANTDKPRRPPQIQSKNVLRVLNSDFSIRKGKFGPYIYYQCSGMQKPAFFQIGKYKKNYATVDAEELIEWIVTTYINI
jgi:DNA topoisomerase-1